MKNLLSCSLRNVITSLLLLLPVSSAIDIFFSIIVINALPFKFILFTKAELHLMMALNYVKK